MEKDDDTVKDNYNNSYLEHADKRKTFHKNDKQNNFTLTDHFKMYQRKPPQDQDLKKQCLTQNESSQKSLEFFNQGFPGGKHNKED